MARIATVAACSPMLVSATGTSSRTCGQGFARVSTTAPAPALDSCA